MPSTIVTLPSTTCDNCKLDNKVSSTKGNSVSFYLVSSFILLNVLYFSTNVFILDNLQFTPIFCFLCDVDAGEGSGSAASAGKFECFDRCSFINSICFLRFLLQFRHHSQTYLHSFFDVCFTVLAASVDYIRSPRR